MTHCLPNDNVLYTMTRFSASTSLIYDFNHPKSILIESVSL